MRKPVFVAVVLACLALSVCAEEDEGFFGADSKVVLVNENNFDTVVKGNPSVLLMVFAPWCGHCKKMKPAFAELAASVDGHVIAALDATASDKEFVSKLGVSGYPTVQYYKDGEFQFKYSGGRSVADLTAFLADPRAPPPPPPPEDFFSESDVAVLGENNFTSFMAEHDSVLVMFYAPWCGHCKNMKPDFKSAATLVKEAGTGVLAAVDCTVHKSLPRTHGIKGFPTIKHFKDGEFHTDYTSTRKAAALAKFMEDPKPAPPPPPPEVFFDDDDNVEVLTDKNFKSYMAEHPSVLVMFYAPWCGHCKSFKPKFREASLELPDGANVAAIDCTVAKALCSRFDIRGYPSLRYFKDGELEMEYPGTRTKNSVIEFLRDPKPPPPPPPPAPFLEDGDASAVAMLTATDFDAKLKEYGNVLVMFYAPWCGHCKSMKPAYAEAASESPEGFTFAAVDCTAEGPVCQRHGVRGYPTLKFFKDGKHDLDYEERRTKEDLLKFAANPAPPPPPPPPAPFLDEEHSVAILTTDNFGAHISSHDSVLVMFYAPWCGHCKKMKPDFAAAAAVHPGKFAAVDATVESKLGKQFELKGYPTLIYFENGKKSFVYEGGRTEIDLVSFIADPKPPPPPEKKALVADPFIEGDDTVTMLGADTFDAYIDEHTAAVVMFYAPWCGHCKKMKPAFKEAAATKDGFAAVDCTVHAELCGEYSVSGYPTLIMFKQGEDWAKYQGERTTEALVEVLTLLLDEGEDGGDDGAAAAAAPATHDEL